ncbi:MAG: transcriptional regulator, GntR family [Cryobacterium sp.]|jgi:DNA-binding GntR family transcriptional regulator|nr:transcriptional regulator, GntR family [Cryobacterium sp.]
MKEASIESTRVPNSDTVEIVKDDDDPSIRTDGGVTSVTALDTRPPLLADLAYERLRDGLLVGGDLAVLDQLVEEDLAERLQMSRTPIREALHRLSLVGMIIDNSAGGYEPRRFTTKEVLDHYQVRRELEPLAVSWACELDPDQRALALADPRLTPTHSSPAGDRTFHKAVAAASGSRPLARMISQFVDRLSREGVHAYGAPDDEHELARGHELVIAAMREGDPRGGERAMREHMTLLFNLISRSRPPLGAAVPARIPLPVRPSLAHHAYETLKQAILDGGLVAGTSLIESSTAESLEVSRTTARQALRRLEVEEYLDRDSRGRLVVHRTSRAEFIQECEIRKALDGAAARLAATRISDEELDRLDALLVEDRTALRDGDHERRAVTNTAIHRAIAVASRNKVLLEASDDLSERTFGFGRVAFAIGSRRERSDFVDEHAAMVACLRAGDGDHAAELVRIHIDRSSQLLLKHMEDDNGGPDD